VTYEEQVRSKELEGKQYQPVLNHRKPTPKHLHSYIVLQIKYSGKEKRPS
jgi:hypothetical protein